MQPDLPGDERLLGIEGAGRHGHGGVPRLLHAHVLGIGRPGGERDLSVADLEVIHDVALRAVGDDLGDADLVRRRQLLERLAGRDGLATASIQSRLR